MPSLAQMIANCNAASYYSRTQGEILAKLEEAGFEIYTAVLKENSGFFIKFDESSVTLLPSQANQEYSLPADFSQMVHLAERATSSENWHPIEPAEDLENVLINQLSSSGLLTLSLGDTSSYSYYGPFLDSGQTVNAAAAQLQKIRISPIPDIARFVQLVYSAKWLPIVNQNSPLMLPAEGTYAMEAKATGKLLDLNSDSLADKFDAKGAMLETKFLSWVRNRQIQERPTAGQYLGGFY